MDREMLRNLILEILREEAGDCPVKKAVPKTITLGQADRLDTGNPAHRVYTRDFFTLEESPRLGAGLMEMEATAFPWTLTYDEVDVVLSGRLEIRCGAKTVSAGPGEVILLPKGSQIEFIAAEKTRFVYVTYPADWNTKQGTVSE